MSTYTYTISGDFSGSEPNLFQFRQEIEDSSIATAYNGAQIISDDVNITFESALSAPDVVTLDGLVSSHVPSNIKPRYNFYNDVPQINENHINAWRLMTKMKYGGSDNIGIINYIDVVSYMDSDLTSYGISVRDINGLVVAERTGLTNSTTAINDLGNISNIPTDESVLEVYSRCVDGNKDRKCYVDEIIVYHDN